MKLDKLGIEIKLKEHFSVIRESLDRIGIANKDKKILNPSCYLLHKRGKYYIIHFKQLLELDGKTTNFSLEDKIRTISIAFLLKNWGLIDIVNEDEIKHLDRTFVYVLSFKDKCDWEIKHKYQIGKSYK
jgi:hypothetical protein